MEKGWQADCQMHLDQYKVQVLIETHITIYLLLRRKHSFDVPALHVVGIASLDVAHHEGVGICWSRRQELMHHPLPRQKVPAAPFPVEV